MRVHNALGPGYREQSYQRALIAEMLSLGLRVEEKRSFDLYLNHVFIGRIYLDHLIVAGWEDRTERYLWKPKG